jgi:hypothetical protein
MLATPPITLRTSATSHDTLHTESPCQAFYRLVKPYVIKKRGELKPIAEIGNSMHIKIIRRVGDYIVLGVFLKC